MMVGIMAAALARAVGVERTHDSDGQVKAAVEALGQAVRADFGGGVGALALEGCFSSMGTYCAVP